MKELTWQDIELICKIHGEVSYKELEGYFNRGGKRCTDEELYTEVLNRFLEEKGYELRPSNQARQDQT